MAKCLRLGEQKGSPCHRQTEQEDKVAHRGEEWSRQGNAGSKARVPDSVSIPAKCESAERLAEFRRLARSLKPQVQNRNSWEITQHCQEAGKQDKGLIKVDWTSAIGASRPNVKKLRAEFSTINDARPIERDKESISGKDRWLRKWSQTPEKSSATVVRWFRI